VCEAGRALAEREGVDHQLKFETEIASSAGCDLLLAAGSLQYVESPLWRTLAALEQPPATLMLNTLPVSKGPAFVTLQHIGVAYCPYAIFNDADLLQGFRSAGYSLHDRWECPTHSIHFPLTPERDVHPYSGFLFTSVRSPLPSVSPLQHLAQDSSAFRVRNPG
jgi:putative methyltransferase (TIGR04325 family)